MIRKLFLIIKIMLTPGVTGVPFRVLNELRRQGKRSLRSLGGRRPGPGALTFAMKWLKSENPTRHNGRWVINSFLPPFPSKAYERMFTTLLSGRRLSPVSAFLEITADCMFSCRYCSAKGRSSANLPDELWKKTISDLAGHGCAIAGFTGGEPMTRKDLPELIAHAVGEGMETILFTSGALLDDKSASALKNAGLWAICFSLDSDSPEKFNTARGRSDAFGTVLRAVPLAEKYGFYTMLGAVATPDFVNSKEYLRLHSLAESLNVDELRIVEAMPCGKLRAADSEEFLNDAQISELRNFHAKTNESAPKTKVCAFNQIESPEFFGCGAGTQHLYIDSAGRVCPCDFTPMSFGNIADTPFPELWKRLNDAFGEPRRHCFIRSNAGAIREASEKYGEYPLSPERSCELCARISYDDLPDYFQTVTGRRRPSENARSEQSKVQSK